MQTSIARRSAVSETSRGNRSAAETDFARFTANSAELRWLSARGERMPLHLTSSGIFRRNAMVTTTDPNAGSLPMLNRKGSTPL